ncbi:GOLPH3/VPS74 family protein [Pseudactinotalea sp.]|uniref:GOLPH3/VPS74 family protein n=1 Tax=Pseudactinotalea sp. TaxID=1926260 RepID=UPI003B3AA972
MLIVEALHLLLTTEAGTPEAWSQRNVAASAALITDLVIAERVTLSDEKRPRVQVISTQPTGNPVLDGALPLLAERDGKRLDSLVTWHKLDPRDAVVESLVQQGILEYGERTMLGMGAPKTPERNPEPEQMVRQRLAAVLAGERPPDIGDTTVLAILQAMNVAHKVLKEESGGLRAGQLKKRINEVVESSPAGTAVEKAVQAMQVALMTATTTAMMASGGSS